MRTENEWSRVFPRNSQRPASGSSSRASIWSTSPWIISTAVCFGTSPTKRASRKSDSTAEHHLPVDVVLDVLEGLVSDPHRPIAVVPGQVEQLALRRLRVAVDPIRGLEHAAALLAQVAEVLEEVLHLLGVAEPLERVEREVRVAQPAETVVPRAS